MEKQDVPPSGHHLFDIGYLELDAPNLQSFQNFHYLQSISDLFITEDTAIAMSENAPFFDPDSDICMWINDDDGSIYAEDAFTYEEMKKILCDENGLD